MGIPETLLFYFLIGASVSIAMVARQKQTYGSFQILEAVLAVLFWPFYLAILLSSPTEIENKYAQSKSKLVFANERVDRMDEIIAQVQGELTSALTSLDGWAEDVLAREKQRLDELQHVWAAQAYRIREMDNVLSLPEFTASEQTWFEGETNSEMEARLKQSEQARAANMQKLKQERDTAYQDLMGMLAWVRELVTMIHLAKFTGAPVSRAEELVTQIAASIEGLSEVTGWQSEEPPEQEMTVKPKVNLEAASIQFSQEKVG